MYNDQLLYKIVIWAFFGISLWKEKVALNPSWICMHETINVYLWLYICCKPADGVTNKWPPPSSPSPQNESAYVLKKVSQCVHNEIVKRE